MCDCAPPEIKTSSWYADRIQVRHSTYVVIWHLCFRRSLAIAPRSGTTVFRLRSINVVLVRLQSTAGKVRAIYRSISIKGRTGQQYHNFCNNIRMNCPRDSVLQSHDLSVSMQWRTAKRVEQTSNGADKLTERNKRRASYTDRQSIIDSPHQHLLCDCAPGAFVDCCHLRRLGVRHFVLLRKQNTKR